MPCGDCQDRSWLWWAETPVPATRRLRRGCVAGPPARGACGRFRRAEAQLARSLQLDTSSRMVGGSHHGIVDVSPGVGAEPFEGLDVLGSSDWRWTLLV